MPDESKPGHKRPTPHPQAGENHSTVGPGDSTDASHGAFEYHATVSDRLPLVVPGFEILEELGRGAFGVVYRARDERLDRQVAIKVGLFDDPRMRDRYIKEAKAAALVETPGVVPVLQVGVLEGDQPFVVQRLIDGGTLRKLLSAQGPLTLRDACSLMIEIARVIAQAHARGLIHRDLKPENILIDSAHKPWVADFGLAILESDQRRHRGERAGTPRYMSPEQIQGKADWLDGRADIYALGIILYEMLAGRPPFQASKIRELKEQILHRDPKPISQCCPHIPEEMDVIFQNCCAKKVNDRYASAQGLVDDLEAILAEHTDTDRDPAGNRKAKRASSIIRRSSQSPGTSTRGNKSQPPIERSTSTKRVLQYSLATVLLGLGSSFVYFAWLNTGGSTPVVQKTREKEGAEDVVSEVATAQERAVRFFHDQVAVNGGYVEQVTADLKWREGEGDAGQTSVWVQPPGTPTVGMAYIEAYERTGDSYLLEAARDTAKCLLKGQLHSGGWQDHIDFDSLLRGELAYRTDGPPSKHAINWSSLDDDQTQSALRFLMKTDRALKFKDESIHEAATYALSALLRNQFPNGAWAQRFEELDRSREYPDVAANFPATWPREYPNENFRQYYTLNDLAVVGTMKVMWLASEIYGDQQYRDSALKAADFLLRAQMPEPQPAWAQQYNYDMQPAWGNKLEPPAISSRESQDVIAALIDLAIATGDTKYLAPIPRALDYLEGSRLPDGKMAIFYELRTNRPLYITQSYLLTYDDSDSFNLYGYKISSGVIQRLRNRYRDLEKLSSAELIALGQKERLQMQQIVPDTRTIHSILTALDERGAWVEQGKLRFINRAPADQPMILSQTFINNLEQLSRFLAAKRRLANIPESLGSNAQ